MQQDAWGNLFCPFFAQPLAKNTVERTVAVDSPVRPVAGDPGVELAVADVALEAVLVVDLPLAEHLIEGRRLDFEHNIRLSFPAICFLNFHGRPTFPRF